tara:strand:+ start:536 stop:778 length:243 start_codon:yes stop_codon:yes gene_type:complete
MSMMAIFSHLVNLSEDDKNLIESETGRKIVLDDEAARKVYEFLEGLSNRQISIREFQEEIKILVNLYTVFHEEDLLMENK